MRRKKALFGNWYFPGDLPETLIAMLADLGRFYLPWVSRAVDEGSADLVFENGQSMTIQATDFLKESRGVLLARYLQLRSQAPDAILDRAGILGYFADYADRAGTIPDCQSPPRPAENNPFPSTMSMREMFELLINLGSIRPSCCPLRNEGKMKKICGLRSAEATADTHSAT